MRSWEYNRFGVLMGASSLASCPRWPSLRGYSWPMITLFSLQGDFCATASERLLPSSGSLANSAIRSGELGLRRLRKKDSRLRVDSDYSDCVHQGRRGD